jgi:potassium efflux system protein
MHSLFARSSPTLIILLITLIFTSHCDIFAQSGNVPEPSPAEISVIESLKSKIQSENAKVKEFSVERKAQLDLIENYKKNAQERLKLIKKAGLKIDAKTGQLLRQQRLTLPTAFELTLLLNKVNVDLTTAEIALLDITNINSSGAQPTRIEQLKASNTTLNQLYKDYIQSLNDLANITEQTLKSTKSYTKYLDERLLWIRSDTSISSADLQAEVVAVSTLFSYATLNQLISGLLIDMSERPFLWVLASILFAIALATLTKKKHILKKLAERAQHRHCHSIAPSLLTLLITLLRSQILPVFLIFIAWRSSSPVSWSIGFYVAALSISLLSLLRTLTVRHGLLDAHFETDRSKTKLIHFHSTWAVYSIPILLFLAYALPAAGAPPAGRPIFIIAMLLGTYFTHSLLRPKKRLLASETAPQWVLKTIYLTGIAFPILFIAGYAIGYIASVQTLFHHTITSIAFIGLLLLLAGLSSRWILVSRRNLAKTQARKKYAALRAAESNDASKEMPSLDEVEANSVDVQAIELQTRRIVRFLTISIMIFGIWSIWKPLFPAARSALNNVSLSGSAQVNKQPENDTNKDTASDTSPIPAITNVTSHTSAVGDSTVVSEGLSLGDVIGAILIIIFTLVAARNIPGLLELGILRRINLQPGGNYAVITILRYIIITVGLLTAFSQVGVTWSSVKWLAAAVTLGIGFGLQEIFANFVAGIIILFERPVRLGDVVTIGDVSGRVTQIKIRATTIKQFNNRELLVPNKEFITGQLINWSLCDNILRFEIPVGIAYGSDTAKATEILNELVSKHPNILETPAPDVLFQSFGASSLDFILRGFVNHYDYLLTTQSDLHYQIDNAFREAGIEIAFPQRDIHIRSLPTNTEQILSAKYPSKEEK